MTNAFLRPRAMAITLGLVLAASVVAMSLSSLKSVVPSASAASSDYLLEIDGIKSDSTDKNHPGSIEVMSWSWGASNPTSVGSSGMSAGKISPKPVVISKTVDTTSPAIFMACASGKRIPKVVLTGRRTTGEGTSSDYLRYTFFDVFCESIQHNGGSGDQPMESLSFNYGKIQMEYLPMDSKGKPGATWKNSGWDIKMNKGI